MECFFEILSVGDFFLLNVTTYFGTFRKHSKVTFPLCLNEEMECSLHICTTGKKASENIQK